MRLISLIDSYVGVGAYRAIMWPT